MFLQEHSGCCVDWRHWRGEAGSVVGKTTTESLATRTRLVAVEMERSWQILETFGRQG